jgi:polysaccharide export outer membrane protein
LLSGCAASSLSDAGIGSEPTAKLSSADKDLTGSVTPAVAEGNGSPNSSATLARSSETKTVTTSSSQQTSAKASLAAIATVSTPGSVAYKIGPQDVLEISVFKVAELSKTAQVTEAGTISFPLLGDVAAAGKTARELEKQMATLLGERYLQKPQVSVIVKEFNSQRVTVEGAVKKPGVFPIQGSVSLLQAVAMAQGLDVLSDNTVVVVRTMDGKRAAARFDISDIRDGTAQDPQLQAGDILVAGTSALKEGLNFLKAMPLTSAFAFL